MAAMARVQLATTDPLLTEAEAADYLRVSRRFLTVDRCEGRHHIPFVKVGRLVRYKQSTLNAFIQKNVRGGV